MTTGHVFIATSLDGYIARPDGGIDWLIGLATGSEDHGFDRFIASVDGLIMGRGTYEMALSFDAWPYTKPVVVLSRSLRAHDVRADLLGQVRISADTPEAAMQRAAAEGWARAYVDGGRIIQSFLRAGLIADMVITSIPVLLGSGLPLFGPLDRDIALTHVDTTTFGSGLVQSKYAIG